MLDEINVKVDRVAASQLSKLEIAEIEQVRKEAIAKVSDVVGNRGFDFTFSKELEIWPVGKSVSDKLVFRAYSDDVLSGYALVVRLWPSNTGWAIQHLLIRPEKRMQGIGTEIVRAVESDALLSTQSVDHIVAVPITTINGSFWTNVGYVEGEKLDIPIEKIGTKQLECFYKKIR